MDWKPEKQSMNRSMENLALTSLLHLFLFLTEFCFSTANEDCPTMCGRVRFGYPFGVGEGCSRPGFELVCKENVLYIPNKREIQVVEISHGEVRVNSSNFVARNCPFMMDIQDNVVDITLEEQSPYTFSAKANKLIVVGCNAQGNVMEDNHNKGLQCFAICQQEARYIDGSCMGNGCCQIDIPDIKQQLSFYVFSRDLDEYWTSPCMYAFVADQGARYNFKEIDLTVLRELMNITMELEWAVGDSNCKQAMESADDYACGGNTTCIDAPRGSGYLCECLDGYEGNPYLNSSHGCQDIDECNHSANTSCTPEARCENRVPGYICSCPPGTIGDGLRGRGCHKRIQVILASAVSVLFAGAACLCFVWCYRTRRRITMRAKYFHQNGGLLLKQCFNGTPTNDIKLFSSIELKKATNNFDKKRILGTGGHGTVYRGLLKNGSVVAIKKSQEVAQSQVDQFINELVVLSQINHRNIVKLLGCCLETQVPLLVYEFISNGTLQQKLHECDESSILASWKERLRIAVEIAEALSYLHSHASTPIFHRDVKSSNILLDENCNVKLADFGISRLVALDKDVVTTAVKGTIGYLDPDYFKTGKLTEKSDVYSFGVVLLELLTSLKPVVQEAAQDYSNLVIHFFSYVEDNKIMDIFYEGILREAQTEELLAVAEIARCCLSTRGGERPTMQRVAEDLVLLKDGILSIRDLYLHQNRSLNSYTLL